MFVLADRENKIKVNSVLVMSWCNLTYMVVIDKKLQTNEKLKRWFPNPNRSFKETNELRSALTSQHDHPRKTNIWWRQAKNIPKMTISKFES